MVICWEERAVLLAFRLCCFRLDVAEVFDVFRSILCFGQDVEFDCIGSRSLPFHLLRTYQLCTMKTKIVLSYAAVLGILVCLYVLYPVTVKC